MASKICSMCNRNIRWWHKKVFGKIEKWHYDCVTIAQQDRIISVLEEINIDEQTSVTINPDWQDGNI